MKYRIDDKDDGIDISVGDIKEEKEKLIAAFQQCQQGRCSCPTDEYQKLESLAIENSDEGIQLHLKSKDGLKINSDEIDKCLRYTRARVTKKNED